MFRSSILLALVMLLNGLVAANLLLLRQDTITTSDIPEAETNLPTIPSPPPLSSANSSSTTFTSTSSSAPISNALNNTNNLNNTNDPHGCHKSSSTSPPQNIFCRPSEGKEVDYNASLILQWDPAWEPHNTSLILEIYSTSYFQDTQDSYPEKRKHALYTDSKIINSTGETAINTSQSWLENGAATNLTIVLSSYLDPKEDSDTNEEDEAKATTPSTRAGPTILLLNQSGSNTTSTLPSHKTSNHKKLSESVGIPIGLLAFLALLGLLAFLFLRRRKRRTGDYLKRRPSGAPGGLVGPFQGGGGGGRKRGESFHDEPTKGGAWVGQGSMELQDRNRERAVSGVSAMSSEGGRGHSRGSGSWDWGWGGGSSPPQGHSSGGGDGNVFREEIGRQKTGRGF